MANEAQSAELAITNLVSNKALMDFIDEVLY